MRFGPPVAQQRHQVSWSESLLLHPKANCRDRVGLINREFLLLVIVDEKREEFQFVSLRRIGRGIHQFLDSGKRRFILCFRLNYSDSHRNCREASEMFPFRELRCRIENISA